MDILLFKECYALEKVHGTSAHITWRRSSCRQCIGLGIDNEVGATCTKCDGESSTGGISFFSGGEKYDKFVSIFDQVSLVNAFDRFGMYEVIVFGEAYGGKCQGMSNTYGKELKFVAFDTLVNGSWLTVPKAEKVATDLGFEFVHYVKVSTDLDILDAERDKPSTQAIRNGCGGDKKSEGVVLRPLIELHGNNHARIIAKHKRIEFRETATVRKVGDPAKIKLSEDAKAAAEEYVTDMRLQHVLDKIPEHNRTMESMKTIISAMVEDVLREGDNEIVDTKELRTAVGYRTVALFKGWLNKIGT
jgi:hypothetical protein